MDQSSSRPRNKPGQDLEADGGKSTIEGGKHPRQTQEVRGHSTPIPDDGSDPGSTRVLSPEETKAIAARSAHIEESVKKKQGLSVLGREVSELGDFQLQQQLGEGAMGAVYRVFQKSFQRTVALKVLFPHVAKNKKLVERLQREGRVMGALDHPNIVQGYGVYEDEELGLHYVAMELVEGDSLQKWINKLGKLSVGDALYITLACASALGYAHEQGMVHRDVKPDNVLITRKGVVKVTDLGMVKAGDDDVSLTQTGHAVGTPWYMPLEQAQNAKDADGRCDIYALGCMLYCMLTGNPPFTGQTIVEVIQAKTKGTFPPARTANPEIPDRLDLIIAKMAAKDPKYRYQNCLDLIEDIESLGLANERLDFGGRKSLKSGKIARPSEHEAVMTSTVATPVTEVRTTHDDWYLQLKNAQGKTTSKKISFAEIQRMVGEGLLKPTTQISHHENEGFRSLATFKEFQGLVLERASKKATKPATSRYQSLYKKIEETEIKKEEDAQKLVGTAGYWWMIFLQTAGVVVAVVLAYYFIRWVFQGLGGS